MSSHITSNEVIFILYVYFKQKVMVSQKKLRATIHNIVGKPILKITILQNDDRTCRVIIKFNTDVSRFFYNYKKFGNEKINGETIHIEKVVDYKKQEPCIETDSQAKRRKWFWWWKNRKLCEPQDGVNTLNICDMENNKLHSSS